MYDFVIIYSSFLIGYGGWTTLLSLTIDIMFPRFLSSPLLDLSIIDVNGVLNTLGVLINGFLSKKDDILNG
jgi:hypothetical protein